MHPPTLHLILKIIVKRSKQEFYSDTALLDSASTNTILRDPIFFESSCMQGSRLNCDILTIAGSPNFKFSEGRATIDLLEDSPSR